MLILCEDCQRYHEHGEMPEDHHDALRVLGAADGTGELTLAYTPEGPGHQLLSEVSCDACATTEPGPRFRAYDDDDDYDYDGDDYYDDSYDGDDDDDDEDPCYNQDYCYGCL